MGNTVLKDEKAKILTEYLNADENRTRELLSLSSEEALPKINGGIGCSFSLEELKEYGRILRSSLNDLDLAGVSGGASEGNTSEDFVPIVIGGVVLGKKAVAAIAIGGTAAAGVTTGVAVGVAQTVRW